MKDTPLKQGLKLTIKGAVQGVGFRPFIYRLATELSLTGWVNNSSQGVSIEVEGDRPTLKTFTQRIMAEKPPSAIISHLEAAEVALKGYTTFTIQASVGGEKTAVVLPDLATCSQCLQEIFDPHNRRYHYPFTNCTNCGPRYSIIEGIPYDRHHTTMKDFTQCQWCQREYEDPLNRRFHAQPNACPQCGPQLQLWDGEGKTIATQHDALLLAAQAIRKGKIVALKGLGGFQLLVDAFNEGAVNWLRQRKQRPEKPFALMYPCLELVRENCHVSEKEKEVLLSPQSPLVLLLQKASSRKYFTVVAPHNPYLGVMLPYTPLHHLLLAELNWPVVATSGNLRDEPICIDQQEALIRLGEIAELFLVHNRPIARPVDDSVVRIVEKRVMVLRRARGYAPLPIILKNQLNGDAILAVGGHLKNTVAIARNHQVFLSQYIGNLETVTAQENFVSVINSLKLLYDFEPDLIACDAHPNYVSTHYANSQNLPVIAVQHHLAHLLSCLAENQLEPPVLGVAWDGTGFGLDGTIWGGEFILLNQNKWSRIAHLRHFKIPGGSKAIQEPRRTALGIFAEIVPDLNNLPPQILNLFSEQELVIIKNMLAKNINSPLTSSMGRLFDGIAAILGIRSQVSFEGQGAMELEFAAIEAETEESYPFNLLTNSNSPIIIDWMPMIEGILNDLELEIITPIIAAKFHHTLGEIIISIASQLEISKILLTGGCFQNKYLLERTIKRLRKSQYEPYWHQQIPPNDGGISLGQIIAVNYQMTND
jgi:hydrogenase maturation protein HypF